MNYKYAIDKCIDDREFRNMVNTLLIKDGYTSLGFDDARLSDNDKINDNDILVEKDNIKYTVQTFRNKEISMKEIQETLKDIEKEKVSNGIIVTNKQVEKELKKYAIQNNIEIFDRSKLLNLTNKYD